MRRSLFGSVIFLLLFVPVRAGGTGVTPVVPGKVLRDHWYETRTEQGKLGYLHILAREVEQDGRRLIHTSIREEVTYKRSGDPYSEKQEHDNLETSAGEVIEVGYRINLSKKQQLSLRGRANGELLVLRVVDADQQTKFSQKVPWDATAAGLYAQDCLFQGKAVKAGEAVTIKAFNPSINRVVPTTFTVKGVETTLFGKEKRDLLRLEQTYPKELYLSKTSLWLEPQGGVIVKIQEETPLFGTITYELTTREKATAEFKARVADVEAPIAIDRPINFRKGAPKELLVRVTLQEDDAPATLFVQDARQKVVKADKEAVELQLLVPPKPNGKPNAAPVPEEYLESNYFVRSDDPLLQKLGREAVGDEKDPRQRLELIRKWMRGKFRGNYQVPFATADEVARTMEGDCSEMGVFLAAMCRAVGIPSRLAFGLVYDQNNPGFGGHLWIEVYLDGEWEPVDPTGVLGQLNAAYIKIAHYSMKDILNPDELTEVRRAFSAKMKVELLESK